MPACTASTYILAFVVAFAVADRIPVAPINIPLCPSRCLCRDIGCTEKRGAIICKDVEVYCNGSNFILQLDYMPRNATYMIITGDDMGHLKLDIFAMRFPRLKKLILPNNGIRSLRITMKIRSLNTLVLDRNSLCYLPVRNLTLLPKLEKLMARYNNLTFITDIMFPRRLVDLDLRYNHIETPQKGSFKRLSSLQFLRLDHNSINNINFQAFRYLKRLESLTLDHNEITQLPKNSFLHLTNLSYIGLSHNMISSIDEFAFKQMGVKYHQLHEIRLEHNQIAILETTSIHLLFPRQKIYGLYLYGNPLFCDCELYRIRAATGTLFRDADRAACVSPPELAGTTLGELDLSGCEEYREEDFYYDYYNNDYEP